jgi:hypothetical protein
MDGHVAMSERETDDFHDTCSHACSARRYLGQVHLDAKENMGITHQHGIARFA